jgi:WD40 repeat protein
MTATADGRLVATVSKQGQLQVWDTQRRRGSNLGKLSGDVTFHFSKGGRLLVVAAKARGTRTTQKAWPQPETAPRAITIPDTGEIDLDTSLFATTALVDLREGGTGLWSMTHPDRITKIKDGNVTPLGETPDRVLAMPATDTAPSTMDLYDMTDAAEPLASLGDPVRLNDEPVFLEIGNYLAVANTDGAVRFWDAVAGHCQVAFTGHAAPVVDMKVNHGKTLLATTSTDDTVRLWNIGPEVPLGEC